MGRFYIASLMEGIKPVVTDEHEFENQDKSLLIAFFKGFLIFN